MHERLRTHAESVAFFGGGAREKAVSLFLSLSSVCICIQISSTLWVHFLLQWLTSEEDNQFYLALVQRKEGQANDNCSENVWSLSNMFWSLLNTRNHSIFGIVNILKDLWTNSRYCLWNYLKPLCDCPYAAKLVHLRG